MLHSLGLKDAPCFGAGQTDIGPLSRVNVFFGANGSGKTTISEALRGAGASRATLVWGLGTPELATRVYNRAYVETTIASGSNLPGVFVLGAGSAEAQQELDDLERPKGTIPTAERHLAALRVELGHETEPASVLGRVFAATSGLRQSAWDARSRLPEALRPIFEGFNNSKARLLDEVLAVATKHADTDQDELSLLEQAAGVFDPDATEIRPLPTVPALDPSVLDGYELLGMPVVGSSDVSLAQLIEQLGNSDWVSEGRRYLVHADGRCPFCQQAAPADLARHLADYFDDRFIAQVEGLHRFVSQYRDAAARVRSTLATIEESAPAQMNRDRFATARVTLERALGENDTRLTTKLARTATVVELASLAEFTDDANAVIGAVNTQISTHNERVRNRRSARAELVEASWRYFVRGTIGPEVATYEATMAPLLNAKANLEKRIARDRTILAEAHARLTELRTQLRSSETVIDDINSTLAMVGFTSFALAGSGSPSGGYKLVRDSGDHAADTLSEGERTFITFLYFVHQLRHVALDSASDTGLLVVIDDPISSLDSDILYVVSALTRRIIDTTLDARQKVKQVIVLTHNTQFHKEVTYRRNGDKTAGVTYFLVKKPRQGPSTVERSTESTVTSAYEALWAEVRRVATNPQQRAVGLENILRRIVDNYFTTVGLSHDELERKFPFEQRVAYRSLFAWMNDGSHTIVDALHFAPSEVTTEMYLEVFQEVFIRSGHGQHHAMMMCRDDALKEGGTNSAVALPADLAVLEEPA